MLLRGVAAISAQSIENRCELSESNHASSDWLVQIWAQAHDFAGVGARQKSHVLLHLLWNDWIGGGEEQGQSKGRASSTFTVYI